MLSDTLFTPYCPIDGAYDEMRDANGEVRPHWRQLARMLTELGGDEINRRGDSAARRLREAGVHFRSYDRGQDQAWPLSLTPVVLSAEEWRGIEAGLIQRASLLEAALSDFYGEQRLVRNGDLPAATIAGSPDFLRPMVGATPRGGRFLHFYAADLGRGPDGRWWVLRDRAQAPSGAGYALGNRIALSRTLPETMRDLGVARLAEFFRAWRAQLQSLASPDSAGVCLLTPGPYNDTYYEHAYLARYLGFPLIEGGDLVTRESGAYLRTIAGLERVDVVLRRLDSDFVDPIEFNFQSRLGAPGLAQATRAEQITFANALGSGVVESRALLAFWPKLARILLGEDLLIPNIATWWCGQPEARDHVLANLDRFAIAPAFHRPSDSLASVSVEGARLSAEEQTRMLRRGVDYVGQEIVTLSTTPVWEGDQFAPRPFQMRVFVGATADGWRVMPGGFCRVSGARDPRAISMQRGGLSADVWVSTAGGEPISSLLPQPQAITTTRTATVLTTRAAENLFWLGRYLERTEATLRLLRAAVTRTAERDGDVIDALSRVSALMRQWDVVSEKEDEAPPATFARALRERAAIGAPAVLAQRALHAASNTRDRLSPDAWMTLSRLTSLLNERTPPNDDLDRLERCLRLVAAFAGYAQENMTRGSGWTTLEIGRRVERALAITRFVRTLGLPNASPASLDALLEIADSQITYAQRYFVTLSPTGVADLLVFDDTNPRSCMHQAHRLRDLSEHLPLPPNPRGQTDLRSAVVLFDAAMAAGAPDRVDETFLNGLEAALLKVGATFTNVYLSDPA